MELNEGDMYAGGDVVTDGNADVDGAPGDQIPVSDHATVKKSAKFQDDIRSESSLGIKLNEIIHPVISRNSELCNLI